MKKSFNDFKRMCNFRLIIASCAVLGAIFLGAEPVSAQGYPVSGTITAESGEPVVGASIIIEGTQQGTSTDGSGKYTIRQGVNANSVLVVSYMGYKTQKVNVAGRSVVDIELSEDTTEMDEVVVIGYGTMKKKDLTGAVSAIDGAAITKRQTEQISTALQGAVAGVSVTRTHSAPGATGDIKIRGVASMTAGAAAPHILIDGVPGSMSDVNPNDVADISILKDAASASIYGSRAAAGVVLITTKRAGKSGVSVDYNYTLGIDIPTSMPDYMDAVGYMSVFNELKYNDNPTEGWNQLYAQDLIDNYWTLNAQNPDLYPNTDWVNLVLKKNALRHSHSLSVTAGGDKRKTKLSLGYDDVDGLFKKNLDWKRYNMRLNNDIQLYNWLKVSADVSLRMIDKTNPYYSPSANMRYAAPVFPAVWSDGRMAPGKTGDNLYARMMEGGTKKEENYLVNGKVQVDVMPVKGLTITALFSPRLNYRKGKDFSNAVKYYEYDDDVWVNGRYVANASKTELTETRGDVFEHTTQVYANYTETFGDGHNFSAMLGYENYWWQSESIDVTAGKFPHPYTPYLQAAPTEDLTLGGSINQSAERSFFGRATYNYKSRYYLQANFRYDGSSRFHPDRRWGFFPSVSAGWVITEEEFMAPARDVLSFAKLRVSFGQLGNSRLGSASSQYYYPYQASLTAGNSVGYTGAGEFVPLLAYSQVKASNPAISWETNVAYDIGLDLMLLQNRLSVTADWYHKETRNMLQAIEIPTWVGFTAPDGNLGTMYSKGWELTVGWRDRIGDFGYSVSFNLSDNISTIGDVGTYKVVSGGKIIQSHTEYQAWYGYLSDGIYQSEAELTDSPKTSSNVTVGDIRYKNVYDKMKFNESTQEWELDGAPIINDQDRVLLGGSLPRMEFGGNIALDWKGIDFSITFQGVGKRNSYLSENMVAPIRAQWYNVPSMLDGNAWSKKNTLEQNRNAKYPRHSFNSNTNNYAVSDFWLINGAYFRIKNITLGYTLPDKWTRKVHMNGVRFSVSLADFFTFSHFPKGWDPEVSSSGYPITKSVLFSASLKF